MKICFVLSYAGLTGGIRVIAAHARQLAQLGHQVTVISTPRAAPRFRQRVKRLLSTGQWPGVPAQGPSHLDGLAVDWRILERHRPVEAQDVPDGDVVIATWWETAAWVDALPASKGRKYYFIQHDERIWFPEDPHWADRVQASWMLPLEHITIAGWIADILERTTGRWPHLVPNSVDIAQFDAPPRRRQRVPTVGLMYSTSPFKGSDIAAEAITRVRRSWPDLHVLAFGHPPAPTTPALPADTEYICHPRQAEIPRLYARCDAWLFPSRCEGFGLPILEAMACRTPVIGTPTGAAPELLTDGAGVLVATHDADAFAAGIEQLLQRSEPAWQAMSDTAYQRARAYTWADATARFESALGAHRGSAPQPEATLATDAAR